MTSPSAPKDKFFERVINPYLAEVLQHPQTIEMHEGVLHTRDVEGPRQTESVETKHEAMEQQIFKCQGMVECKLNANHLMITKFTRDTSWMPRTSERPSSSFTRKSTISKPRSMTCKTKIVSMNTYLRG